MSKPRYNWWPFALAIIRDYPARKAALKALREQKITANISSMPQAGGTFRAPEDLAIRQLPPQEQREHDAVHTAINRTRTLPDAKLRMDVVKVTMWKGYSIPDAAITLHAAERTVRRYRWQFVLLVGHMYGFLTEGEYGDALKKDAKK